jgi:8-oxo-dGTP pyrophosphatase MutT (NUDIX family)
MPGLRKACPVVLRETSAGRIEILAFRHPVAGTQLVKGTIEIAESVQRAAERELLEESGLVGTAIANLGTLQMSEPEEHEWHFVMCKVEQPAESWTHWTSDGGGLDFAFFWHPLDQEPDETWHPIFKRALNFIRHSGWSSPGQAGSSVPNTLCPY